MPVTTAIRLRRSMRSENQPIGYCRISPPAKMAPTKIETWPVPSPIAEANTADMPNWQAKMAPSSRLPTTPSGEARKRARNDIGREVVNAGAGPAESSIGRNDSETATDISTNRV